MTVDVIIFSDCSSEASIRYAGAYTIASSLREAGFTVQVVDYFLLTGLEKAYKIIDKFLGENTLFVGFSTTFMNVSWEHKKAHQTDPSMFRFDNFTQMQLGASTHNGYSYGVPISEDEMLQIQQYIKNKNSKTKLVLGGTKADFTYQKYIDTFILGYADKSAVEYAKFLQGKNPFFRYRINDKLQMVVDYDIDAKSHDFVNSRIEYDSSDLARPDEPLPIEISRGCIFKCKFCNFRMIGKKKNDYIKDKEVIYSALMSNYEKFGTTKYSITDDTWNESVGKLEMFAEVCQRLPFKIEYVSYLRLDLIWRYPEMADLLRETGLKATAFGIETLNHEAGKIIGKGLHPEKVRETLHTLRDSKGWRNNILMFSGFIVGLPTETRDTVNKWVEELMDFNYPLDAFQLNALFLGNNKHKSEFDLNYKDYGYWYDKKVSTGWINEHWRVEDAGELSSNMHNYGLSIGRLKANGFYSMIMQNYGFTWEDVHNTSMVGYGSLFQKTLTHANTYHERLLNEV